ncbi:hypothetical protein BN946_scf184999.g31 [Trametes cinnabarina]|uniref:Mixed lineage kinase domain-containing protein n=1 Tax=Pycnoporus cinnabarinus TaxID=5643 RepID=A0A060S840_PYCCI|nr:hypothetical protein BN946_scf184999.g31 [Trametes cinnabarina]
MQFPPAQAAAGILLLVFETIQKIQLNKDDCYRLAQRCLSMLVDIRDHMAEHQNSAPASLLKAISKFEVTLESICKFMQQEAEQAWGTRLIRKGSIELAMKHHHMALDDAIASLINIQLSLRGQYGRSKTVDDYKTSSVDPSESLNARRGTSPALSEEIYANVTDVEEICLSPGPTSAIFNRYHQSQFAMKGKSRIKSGWWAGGLEGELEGRKSLMLRYEGNQRDAMKRWMRDVKLLQNIYHPNLPQMIGYSNDQTPTPFIILSNVQTRLPQAMLLNAIKNAPIVECARMMLRLHADLRIDAEHTVVIGLPPPEIDHVESWRNYGLAHSIRSIYLRILPDGGYAREPVGANDHNGETIEKQRKISHLSMLARILLPDSENLEIVKKRLQEVLAPDEDDDEEAEISSLTLRQLRKAALAAGIYQQAWHRNNVPPHKFLVGDLGYLPQGSGDWSDFVVCCNLFGEGLARADTASRATGTQGAWGHGAYERQDLSPFDCPGDVSGWPVIVLPEADFILYINHEVSTSRVNIAWDYLLENGDSLSKQYGVKPEELILVTRVGCEQRFRIRDLRQVHYWPASMNMPSHPHKHGFASGQRLGLPGQFGHQGLDQRRLVPGQDLHPKLFYLFTSGDKDYQSHFTEIPTPVQLKEGDKAPDLDPNIEKCFAYRDSLYGNLDYVQLHAEDFGE